MKKISVTELRKTIKAAEAERLKQQLPFQPKSPKLVKNRAAAETMLTRWMSDSGLNKLEALQKQRDAELLRLAAIHKKEALRLATVLGIAPPRVIVFGIEAQTIDPQGGLSQPVLAAVPELVERLLNELEGGSIL